MHHARPDDDHKQPRQNHGQARHHAFGFVALSGAGSAEAALNLTQPTVSKTIQALEEELGVPLLVKENGRKKRQVATTPIGEEVYRHALNLLHERDLLLARIDGYRHMVVHHMGIALLPEYYARKINPDIFAAVTLSEPEIRWKLTMA